MHSEEFKEYFSLNHFYSNPQYGYIHITVNKEYYFPGQLVRGRVYVQLTKTIRTNQAVLKINGIENNGYSSKKKKPKLTAAQK